MRKLLRYSFLMFPAAALLAGCSDSNVETTADVHPAGWYELHRASTSVATFTVDCGGCHVVVANQPGPASPPSCFSASFDGRSCHPNGPGAPHPMTDAFLNGGHGKLAKADLTFCQECHSDNPNGGPGSNPRFNVGINNAPTSAPGTGCEQCHGVNYAHPATWAGPGTTFHYSAGNIQAACKLCHGVALDGAGGVGIDCTTCHANTTTFTLDCAACHQFPLPGTAPEPVVAAEGGTLVPHTAAMIDNHDQCATCHGMKNTNAGTTGNLNPSANYQAFNKTTDTIGDHWNGQINMNGDTEYNETTFSCNYTCHAVPTGHQLADSNLPVALGNYGAISPSLHAIGAKWLLKSQHATEAVNGQFDCFICHGQTSGTGTINPACQDCHQVAPKMDLSNAGCTSCHNYPPDGVTPVAGQPNQAGKHAKHFGLTADTGNCSACHQGGGSDSLTHYDRTGTVPNYPAEVVLPTIYNANGPALYDPAAPAAQNCASVSCHGGVTTPNWYTGTLPTTSPTASNEYCLSCHTGTGAYNSFSSGEHNRHVNNINPLSYRLCINCHNTTVLQNGVGGIGPTHWSDLDTQVFELDPASTVGGSGTLVISYNGATNTCIAACHGSNSMMW